MTGRGSPATRALTSWRRLRADGNRFAHRQLVTAVQDEDSAVVVSPE